MEKSGFLGLNAQRRGPRHVIHGDELDLGGCDVGMIAPPNHMDIGPSIARDSGIDERFAQHGGGKSARKNGRADETHVDRMANRPKMVFMRVGQQQSLSRASAAGNLLGVASRENAFRSRKLARVAVTAAELKTVIDEKMAMNQRACLVGRHDIISMGISANPVRIVSHARLPIETCLASIDE
jgi:hypothetical protein